MYRNYNRERHSKERRLSADVSESPTWTRQIGADTTTVFGHSETEERAQRSPDENTLTLTDVQLGDSGLYSCAEGAAVYLNETKDPTDTSQKGAVAALKSKYDWLKL